MTLDLDLDDIHHDLRRTLQNWLARSGVSPTTWSSQLWQGLAGLGILSLVAAKDHGDPLDLVVAHECLGEAATTGPLASAVIAGQLLDPEEAATVAAGTLIPGVAVGDLVPWGQQAEVFIVQDGEQDAWRAEPTRPPEAISTLGGEPWARAVLQRTTSLGDARRANALADLAVAAWLVGAGRSLVSRSTDHARDRHQFGRPIGSFQAVAHRLARCDAELVTARDLVRVTAWRLREGIAASPTGARLVSSQAAMASAYAAHQVHGALGYAQESHLGDLSTGIRQRALHPPQRQVHGRGPA